MSEERTIRELLAESAPIIDQLTDVVNTAKKAFVHQRGQLLAQLNNQQDPLCREIRSTISKMSTLTAGKTAHTREPYLRIQSILTHLLIIAETTCRLEETLHKQIKDGVLFSDKAILQVSHIFDAQTKIFSDLATAMRNADEDIQHLVEDECNKLGQFCLQCSTDHENRLVEGLCYPQAAPLFLALLDQMQTIVHHEREVAHLLGRAF